VVEWSGCERSQVGGRSHMVATTSAGDSAVKALAEGVVKLAIVATIPMVARSAATLVTAVVLAGAIMPEGCCGVRGHDDVHWGDRMTVGEGALIESFLLFACHFLLCRVVPFCLVL
jgi:hypothetical protein